MSTKQETAGASVMACMFWWIAGIVAYVALLWAVHWLGGVIGPSFWHLAAFGVAAFMGFLGVVALLSEGFAGGATPIFLAIALLAASFGSGPLGN